MNYISLGPTCSVAYQLQQLNLKKESLPFDWIRSNNISFVLELIKNNFKNFFDDLIHVKDDDKFPYINDDSSEMFDDIKDKQTNIYKTKNIGFFHDFKQGTTLQDVKEKYDRRIKRFYDVSRNKSVFIRDEIYFKVANIPIYNEINKIIKEFNNDNQLVLIININKIKMPDITAFDSTIKIIFDSEKITEWQHPAIIPYIKSI
jgi:hypothetical protein